MCAGRRFRAAVSGLTVAAALALAACGGSGHSGGGSGRPGSGWGVLRAATGTLPYPHGWTRLKSDPGGGSAALIGPGGSILAYLNATPATPDERQAGWARFRLAHLRGEHERSVRLLSSAPAVRLGAARAACVSDLYTTIRSNYRELSCLVAPVHGGRGTVLVAAAQPGLWSRERAALEYALHHFAAPAPSRRA